MSYFGISLGTWILVISTLLYVAAGVAFWTEKQYGLSVAYVAYAIANVGLMMVALSNTGVKVCVSQIGLS